MLVTLVVILCHALPGGVPGATPIGARICVEEIVTEQASMPGCLTTGQIGLPKWIDENRPGWDLERYKCVPGHYEVRGRV